jgi:transposase
MFSLEEIVAPDSWARLVDIFVDVLPLEQLGFCHIKPKDEGRPPYHPAVLLKLYMYGYKHGVRTSRKLEHACKVNIELWWLLKGQTPSARTIAAFRKENKKAFRNAFRHFVLLLREWDLISGETIAIDSFKIRAQNSLKNNFNQNKIDRHIQYIDNKINEYESQLEQDESEECQQEIKDKIAYQQQKKGNYNTLKQELEASGESQISLTDPDAKSVVLHRNIVNVGYNIQAACDEKHKLLVHNDTGNVNDTHDLAPMAIECKKILKKENLEVLADKGYHTGQQLQTCQDAGITAFVSPKAPSTKDIGLFPVADFIYNRESDTYLCPAGNIMSTNGKYYKHSGRGKNRPYRFLRYTTPKCKGCQLREKCTKNQANGRVIDRSEFADVMEANNKRVSQNPDYYRQRQQITEHQFGTLKRQWGFTYTLMKGKEHVLSEVNLYFIIYNLRRLVSILGPEELKSRLKKLGTLIFLCFLKIRLNLSPNKAFF